MTASRSLTLTPAFALSGLLHGALVMAFVVYALVAKPAVPFGRSIEVSMVELPSAAPAARAPVAEAKPAVKPAEPKPGDIALPKKTAEKVAEAAPNAAAPSSAAAKANGPVGEATGRDVGEMDRYLYELRVTLETRKTYPTLSRRLREAGEVMVEFKVKKDGTLEAVNVVKESGFARLNDAAVQLVASLGRFRPLPEVAAGRGELSVKLPIRYALD